jgi:hypothetical protein
MGTDQVATVRSWDAGRGAGLLARGPGRDDLEISRELLVDGADLAPGQRVAFRETYEPTSDAEWHWAIHDVRVVSDEEAAVLTLERLCRDLQHAEAQMSTAQELASDDDVETAREDMLLAMSARDAGIRDIGRQVFEQGGSEAAGRVFSRLAQEHQSTVAHAWKAAGWL